jgi:hypothetical protein
MAFSYVIGKSVTMQLISSSHARNINTEHMEEDEETTKAIPPWVELEYAV